jgi:hypothetical protein
MNIVDKKSTDQLLKSVLAEIAKAQHELKCAAADQEKAQSRLRFALMVTNKLIERQGD